LGLTTKWVVAISAVAVVVAVTLPTLLFMGVDMLPRGDYVALLELSGVLSYEDSPISLFGRTLTPSDVESMVMQARQDPSAKAVVLVINSPGGSAAASEEIYSMFMKLAEEKPVVAYIAEYGASGGYYIALPAEKIVASPSALTGSVGAVALMVNYANLTERLGIKAYVFKSGVMKDVGNPFRELSKEEAELMQSLVSSIADTFVSRVREARGGMVKDWDEVLTARPFTGVQALEAGLVDEVGTMRDAVGVAGMLAGLPAEPEARWIKPEQPSLFEIILGGSELFDRKMRLSYEVLLMWPLPEGLPLENVVQASQP